MSAELTLMFIHLGPSLPAWLPDTLAQARLVHGGPILLVAERAALDAAPPLNATLHALEELGLSERQAAFRRASTLDRDFRGGFWNHTTERFFVLERAMERLATGPVAHLENDVLLYANTAALAPKLAALYPTLAATFDNDRRCVPGFVYAANAAALGPLTDFILKVMDWARTLPPQQRGGINDMSLLGGLRLRVPGAMDALPIVPPDYPGPLKSSAGHIAADPTLFARHFTELGMVFDAAALGQFLGGVDPRNASGPTQGFVNESCVFDPRLLQPRMAMFEGLRRPVIQTPSGIHPVANLHVHAKTMMPFLSAPAGA